MNEWNGLPDGASNFTTTTNLADWWEIPPCEKNDQPLVVDAELYQQIQLGILLPGTTNARVEVWNCGPYWAWQAYSEEFGVQRVSYSKFAEDDDALGDQIHEFINAQRAAYNAT